MEESKMSDNPALPLPPAGLTVVIAINGKRKSKYIVGWALDKFAPDGDVEFRLLHVRPKITSVPTPMGASLAISEVREDVAAAYRQEKEWQAKEKLLPFKKMCERIKAPVNIKIIESDDIVNAITEEVNRHFIHRLVIGVSSRGFFSRKHDMCSTISTSTPSFCTVYCISKGKLSSIRPSESEAHAMIRDEGSERTSSSSSSSDDNSGSNTGSMDATLAPPTTSQTPPLPPPRTRMPPPRSISTPMETSSVGSDDYRRMSLDAEEPNDAASINRSISDSGHAVSWTPRLQDLDDQKDARSSSSSNRDIRSASWTSMVTDNLSRVSNQAPNFSDAHSDHSYAENQVNLNLEIEKLRVELRHVREMYAMAQNENMDASRKLHELNQRRLEEAVKLEELKMKEEEARLLALDEQQRCERATCEVESVREQIEKEVRQRREAERRTLHDTKEKEKFESTLAGPSVQFQHFTWEEILAATGSFSNDRKIGMGGYGTVYKCNLHHTTAAVKVLHLSGDRLPKRFLQELEILSKIRHPHLLLLLGACPERGCLVYEYMENGSLEDRLLRQNDTPAIPWFDRFRIAWEVASALIFLHKSKPKPIIHRDLKPANILLDYNLVSKVGDVGLSTMVQGESASKFTMYKDTSPVGSLCYIDPEYQRTGLISPKSDVYSLGMVIFQLLTAKPAIALAHVVERAISGNGNFSEILDPRAGNWPVEETRELAVLGLCCTELRRKDRPDLKDHILPTLDKLRRVAEKARSSTLNSPAVPPSHFICPLLKDVMNEPCVAADGYTYDRHAMEQWLSEHETSPMTNLTLPNKSLLPNYTLYTAIVEWKSRRH